MVKYSMSINSQEVNRLPNIKSAIKRVKVSETKTLNNTVKKSALKTSIKKCKEAIADKDSAASEIFNKAVKTIDKAAANNLLHKNTAARKKSRLAKALNAASK
jgi:small subunit ribosomal protein S20